MSNLPIKKEDWQMLDPITGLPVAGPSLSGQYYEYPYGKASMKVSMPPQNVPMNATSSFYVNPYGDKIPIHNSNHGSYQDPFKTSTLTPKVKVDSRMDAGYGGPNFSLVATWENEVLRKDFANVVMDTIAAKFAERFLTEKYEEICKQIELEEIAQYAAEDLKETLREKLKKAFKLL